MSQTIIIGAGPAGLTTAYELAKLGTRSLVLEADNQVGGLARMVNYHGYRFDIGGHRFFTKVPYIQQIWEEILEKDFLLHHRLSRIHYKGKFFDYPLKPINALAGLGPLEAFLVGLSYLKAKLRATGEEKNFEQWVSKRFGYRLYEIFFKTYTEKVWGMPCQEISADWAAQRIKNLSLKKVLRDALVGNGRAGNGRIITTLIDQFYYPRLGAGMMWQRCAELLDEQGSQILLNARVQRIRHRQNFVESVYGRTSSGQSIELSARQLVSTMPIRDLILTLEPAPPDEIVQAAKQLRHRDYIMIALIVKREQVFSDNWIYIHTPEVKVGRIQNYKNWSPEMVPDPAKTTLGLEYFLWEKDEEWDWPEDRLVEFGIRECAQIGLIEPREVQDGTVIRMKKAYPVYDQKYHENLTTLRKYLETFSNLQTIGRNGLHRYNNQDHSMLTGVYAARNILGETYDVWTVNTEKEYQEEIRTTDLRFGDRLVPTAVEPEVTEHYMPPGEVIEWAFAKLDPVALGIAVGLISGLGLFLATILLLLKGGAVQGPNLSLLGNYFFGFKVTWLGAFLGFLEAGIGGFVLGSLVARLRNWGILAYATLVRRHVQAAEQRTLLDKV